MSLAVFVLALVVAPASGFTATPLVHQNVAVARAPAPCASIAGALRLSPLLPVVVAVPFARRATFSFVTSIMAAAWLTAFRSARRRIADHDMLESFAKVECEERGDEDVCEVAELKYGFWDKLIDDELRARLAWMQDA